MCEPTIPDIPLSSRWPDSVRSAVIYVISLAHYAIPYARGWAANSINARVRLAAENNRLKQETQLLREEIRIKDARMAKIGPHRRPYYPPTERMAILELKAARAWSLTQTARVFSSQACRRGLPPRQRAAASGPVAGNANTPRAVAARQPVWAWVTRPTTARTNHVTPTFL